MRFPPLRLIRNYIHLDDLIAVNLTHIVTIKQSREVIFFFGVNNREISVVFPDEMTAKKEMVDIMHTLNSFAKNCKNEFGVKYNS